MSLPSSDFPKCRIVVDAMGGDFAPHHEVIGALSAFSENKFFHLILVGDDEKIKAIAKENNLSLDGVELIHSEEIITMNDSPTSALKTKQKSSLVIGAKLVASGGADAFVSTGNTGAVAAAGTLLIGRLAGVERPTIGTYIPNMTGITTVFDVGAFVDSKPQHMLGYAQLANVYVKEMFGIEKPTVGLLSVGEENEKGNKLTKETFELLKSSKLNFFGNIEGRDILTGKVNIVICDGFVGNILLKFGESFLKILKPMLKKTADANFFDKVKIAISRNAIRKSFKVFDPNEYGGIPLLGVKAITIIGHGSSTVYGIKNMVLKAKEMYDKKLIAKLAKEMNKEN
ncbi:MAG: phosphate acyltransferase PlsX [Ignavibacteria bacterium CG22_combo_CG10-13_8_21_14_all_37_15]|nr:MAG: phosphate acyltransferase PlsX [Ignavibacteria bacterium CG22_combo_CG10-13_8_21_14_all_37_15]